MLRAVFQSGIAKFTSGTIDNTVIGGTTPAAATFTTLTANGAVSLSPANANVVISPTGSGLVTINPATAGTINNVVIGGTTPLAGTFTVLKGATQDVTGKTIINNNAATPVTIGANISYVAFTGTNLATLTINFPNAAAAIDGLEITVYFSAAVGTALTLASTGATFVDAPATVAAKTRLSYIYDNGSTQWIPD